APKVYAYNGSVYVINPESIKSLEFSQFKKVKKYVMDDLHSIDIDTPLDWHIAEAVLESNLVKPGVA
ncbi:MAG: acylneuraminate cytidylyltransferase family protein, partial [Bacteroidetes bacterium]|nr:acylneuraminate cytidylyltransferase family protein [Bacteroidota bacterium]